MKNIQSNIDHLAIRLNQISKIFDIDQIINTKISQTYINRYYNVNKIPYSIFQDREFIHFAISRDGKFSKEDYLEAPNFVENILKVRKPKMFQS